MAACSHSVMSLERAPGGWDAFLSAPLSPRATAFTWLGQAGFAFRHDGQLFMVDPYLSDHLAIKYRDAHFPHVRMMAPPVSPEDTPPLNAILCSHRHSDHMDPLALPVLLEGSAGCTIVVPRAEQDYAISLGLPESSLAPVNAGDTLDSLPGISLRVVPAAHEELDTDEHGNHRYLGFVLTLGPVTLYHGGDTVPYEGLAACLKQLGVQVALLPVNGRDAYRRGHGVPGNMTMEEALALCRDAGIPWLVPHHFGMFEFNTVEPSALEAVAVQSDAPRCLVPGTDHFFVTAMEDD